MGFLIVFQRKFVDLNPDWSIIRGVTRPPEPFDNFSSPMRKATEDEAPVPHLHANVKRQISLRRDHSPCWIAVHASLTRHRRLFARGLCLPHPAAFAFFSFLSANCFGFRLSWPDPWFPFGLHFSGRRLFVSGFCLFVSGRRLWLSFAVHLLRHRCAFTTLSLRLCRKFLGLAAFDASSLSVRQFCR
jgi:hypothetical protein